MTRPTIGLSILLASTLILGFAAPACAGVQLIWLGTSASTQSVTRLVPTSQTMEERGLKQLVDTQPRTEKHITGSMSTLISEWEIRRYQTPITTYRLKREEARETVTMTDRYIHRTTRQVPVRSWTTWVVGAAASDGKRVLTDLVQAPPYWLNPDTRDNAWPYLPHVRSEQSQAKYDSSNALAVSIHPYGDSEHLAARLFFDKNLNFLKGLIYCHGRRFAGVPNARVLRYGDHDAIEYRLSCANNEDWNPVNNCGTGDNTWTVHLDGKLLSSRIDTEYRTETRDMPHDRIRQHAELWKPTGRMIRSDGKTRLITSQETVLVNQRTGSHGANLVASVATAIGGRRVFTGDSGSGGSGALLSSAGLRQALGADRVAPSRQTGRTSSHGAPLPMPPKQNPHPSLKQPPAKVPPKAPVVSSPRRDAPFRIGMPSLSQPDKESVQRPSATRSIGAPSLRVDPVKAPALRDAKRGSDSAPLRDEWRFPGKTLQPRMRTPYSTFQGGPSLD